MNGRLAAVRMLRRAAWAPGVVLAAHWALLLVQAYERYPDLDIAMHFFGGLAVAHLIARGLDAGREAGAARLAPPGLEILMILACTSFVAVLWELHELALDTLVRTRQLGDAVDTLGDLTFGLLGAAAYAALRWRRGSARPGD